MKKIILIITLISSILLIGCNKPEEVAYEIEPLPEPIRQTKNSINVTVDPRTELLSIVHYLSDYREVADPLMTSFEFDYTKAVDLHFGKFEDHEVVAFIDELSLKGFNFDAPPTLMLYMSNEFTYREDTNLEDYLINRAVGKENIERLMQLLSSFAIESDFSEFFNDNHEYYSNIIDNTLYLIDDEKNIVRELEDYYGMSKESYNLILVSLYGPVGYGPQIEINEKEHNYSIIGSQGTQFKNDGKMPSFGTIDSFEYLQNHEFSHSFINPMTEKNIDLANSYNHLFEPIRDKMERQAYGNWETCLNEHIIRALTSRFAYLTNAEEGQYLLSSEMRDGFIYVEKLFHKLEEYENNRDIYPTFEDFYSELLSVLD